MGGHHKREQQNGNQNMGFGQQNNGMQGGEAGAQGAAFQGFMGGMQGQGFAPFGGAQQEQGMNMQNGFMNQGGAQNMQHMGAMQQPTSPYGQTQFQNPYYQTQQAQYTPTGGQQTQGGYQYSRQGYSQNPYYQTQGYTSGQNKSSIFSSYLPKGGFNIFGETPSDKLLRGLLIGGAAAYILTNENAQKAIIKAGVKLYGALAGGLEEFKEKIMDAKAEMEAEKTQEEEL